MGLLHDCLPHVAIIEVHMVKKRLAGYRSMARNGQLRQVISQGVADTCR